MSKKYRIAYAPYNPLPEKQPEVVLDRAGRAAFVIEFFMASDGGHYERITTQSGYEYWFEVTEG